MAHEYAELGSGSGGVKVAVDRVTVGANSLDYQLVQLTVGADAAAKTIVGEAAPLPIRLSDGTNFITNLAANITQIAGSSITAGAGAVAAGTPRVTLASDDPAVVDLAAIEVLLGTIDADTGAIKTAVETLDNAISGAGFNITQLNGAAVPIGAGVEATAVRVTLATDSTGVVSVDDNGGSLTIDNAGITTIAGAVSGTEMQVDIVAALPAGTNAIGKLAPNSGVDIGDVDVLSIIPGTGATNLGKAEDAAHTTGDVGVMLLAVRTDAGTARAGTDGDYIPLSTDEDGNVWVNAAVVASHGVFGSTSEGGSPGAPVLTGGRYDATPRSLSDGQQGALAINPDGALHISDGGNTITVDNGGTFAVQAVCTNAGTFAVQAAQSGTWTVDLGATDNAVLDAIAASLAGTLTVGSHAVTNAGTFAVQVDGNALTALQLIDDAIFTDDAAYTPGTSKLVVVGAQADEDSTDAVNEGDAGALRMTLERKLRTVAALDSAAMQSGNDQVTPKFAVISASGSGDNTLVAAVTDKKIRVLSYSFIANGTVTVRFESGAAGTALSGQMDFVAQTGISVPFSPVGHFETAASTLLNLELSGAVEVAGHLTYIEVD